MSFANLLLLSGAGLVVVQILLHLLMRQQPKRVVFPAVRFIRQRQHANRRRLRFRHLLLLIARCAAILLFVLALARPSISPEDVDRFVASSVIGGLAIFALVGLAAAWMLAARRWVFIVAAVVAALFVGTGAAMALSWLADRDETELAGSGTAPVAAAFVFDTSPRTAYKQDGKTRLDVAREFGLWLVGELPAESEIAVLNSRSDSSAFAVDRGAARTKIESLKPTTVALAMPQVISEAIDRVRESALEHREVYVFTDLTSPGWPSEATRQLASRLEEAKDVRLYIVDTGVKKPINVALGDLRRFEESLAAGGELSLRLDVSSVGASGPRAVELHVYNSRSSGGGNPDERPTDVRARRSFTVGDGQAQHVELTASGGFAEGATQGYVQLVGDDGLAWDDRRYFTVTVEPPKTILVASPKPVADYVTFLAEAIAPAGLGANGRYRCEVIEITKLASMTLEELRAYAAVCLVDPAPETNRFWTMLGDYARLGGGVGVFLGRNAGGTVRSPVEKFNTSATGFLPAPLLRIRTRTAPPFQLVTDRRSDAILAGLSDYVVPWSAYPVYKFWEFGPLPPGARAVATFDSGHAAIIDQPLGQGVVVWMATPVSDAASVAGHWNLIPTADPPWPFLAIVDGLIAHLTGGGADRFNYTTGEPVALAVEESIENVVVTTPLGDNLTIRPDAKQRRLFFSATDNPGSYVAGQAARLTSGGVDSA